MRIIGSAFLLFYASCACAQGNVSESGAKQAELPDAPSAIVRPAAMTLQPSTAASLQLSTAKPVFRMNGEDAVDSSLVFAGSSPKKTESPQKTSTAAQPCARYYWHGTTERNVGDTGTSIVSSLPTASNCAYDHGGFFQRSFYALTRVIFTPGYDGLSGINTSELLGRGMTQAMATGYYPQADRTLGVAATKFGYALGRDALQSLFREFWPDVSKGVLHRHPE
jgi:hypothetical protein